MAPTTDYELVALIPGSLKPSEAKRALEKLDAEVKKLGSVKNKTTWENRPLAYKMGQDTVATFAIYYFSAEPKVMREFADQLRLDPQILRSLIVKTPKNYTWKEYTEADLEWNYEKVVTKEVKKPAAKKPFGDKPARKPAAKKAE